MRKFLAFFMTVCMLFTLVACNNNPSVEDETTLPGQTGDAISSTDYKAGDYSAASRGMNADVQVNVTFSENEIVSVKVGEHHESVGVCEPAIERIPAAIVEHQSLSVDTISGATMTSYAIIRAVTDCVEQAGGDVDALRAVAIEKPVSTAKELTTQAVVVGGGVAGLSTALALDENGIDVILVENNVWLGGEALVSGGKLQGTGSQAQIARGLDEDPNELYEYYLHITERMCNMELQKEVVNRSADIINWLESIGVEFEDILRVEGDTMVARGLRGNSFTGGNAVMFPIITKAQESGMQILTETRATDVIQDESGTVTGIIATNLVTNETFTINADVVVLATGNNSNATTPEIVNWGREMAQKLGAGFKKFETVEPYGAIYGMGGLYLDTYGDRFTNEMGFYGRVYDDLYQKTKDTKCFMVLSQKNLDENTKLYDVAGGGKFTWAGIVGDEFTLDENDDLFIADTLEDAFALAGMDVDRAMASIERYNELCAQGEDTDFHKPEEDLFAINEGDGPYYVYEVLVRESYSEADPIGNPVCNVECQILKPDGSPIPGLYGAGELFNTSIRYRLYPGSGTYILFGLAMGDIIGDTAVEYINNN